MEFFAHLFLSFSPFALGLSNVVDVTADVALVIKIKLTIVLLCRVFFFLFSSGFRLPD